MHKLHWVGVGISILYLFALAYFKKFDLVNMQSLTLNELGDFLAGAFGPLALFWLILGFFQQGIELRNSAEALSLQASELHQSVKQQERIAKSTTEQFELQKEIFENSIQRLGKELKPRFVVTYNMEDNRDQGYNTVDDSLLRHLLTFANVGGTACEVNIIIGYGQLEPSDHQIVIWPQFTVHERYIELYALDTHGDEIQLDLSYNDINGETHIEEFSFNRTKKGEYPTYEVVRL